MQKYSPNHTLLPYRHPTRFAKGSCSHLISSFHSCAHDIHNLIIISINIFTHVSRSTNEDTAKALEQDLHDAQDRVNDAETVLRNFEKRVADVEASAAAAAAKNDEQQEEEQPHTPVNSRIKALGALWGGVAEKTSPKPVKKTPIKHSPPKMRDSVSGDVMSVDDVDCKRVELETEVSIERKKFNKLKKKWATARTAAGLPSEWPPQATPPAANPDERVAQFEMELMRADEVVEQANAAVASFRAKLQVRCHHMMLLCMNASPNIEYR